MRMQAGALQRAAVRLRRLGEMPVPGQVSRTAQVRQERLVQPDRDPVQVPAPVARPGPCRPCWPPSASGPSPRPHGGHDPRPAPQSSWQPAAATDDGQVRPQRRLAGKTQDRITDGPGALVPGLDSRTGAGRGDTADEPALRNRGVCCPDQVPQVAQTAVLPVDISQQVLQHRGIRGTGSVPLLPDNRGCRQPGLLKRGDQHGVDVRAGEQPVSRAERVRLGDQGDVPRRGRQGTLWPRTNRRCGTEACAVLIRCRRWLRLPYCRPMSASRCASTGTSGAPWASHSCCTTAAAACRACSSAAISMASISGRASSWSAEPSGFVWVTRATYRAGRQGSLDRSAYPRTGRLRHALGIGRTWLTPRAVRLDFPAQPEQGRITLNALAQTVRKPVGLLHQVQQLSGQVPGLVHPHGRSRAADMAAVLARRITEFASVPAGPARPVQAGRGHVIVRTGHGGKPIRFMVSSASGSFMCSPVADVRNPG